MFREILDIYSYHSKSTTRFAEHDCHNVFKKALRDLKECGFQDIKAKRILDLGCGQRYPFALLCSANDANVTALDMNYIKPDFLPLSFLRTIKHNGFKRAAKTVLRRMLWDNLYYSTLETCAEKPSIRSYQSRINFIVSDPTKASYPLPSNSFDLIASNAVLEHIMDVSEFAKEALRLLDSGGILYVIIHNFYSLSGGHNLEWAFPDEFPPDNIPPWDHLREKRFPAWVYLNHWRPEQFKDVFSKYFQILQFENIGINHDCGELEGERFLTAEIAAELKSYSRELLLTRSWRMICKKA